MIRFVIFLQGTLQQQQQQLQQQPGMGGSRGGSGQVLMTEQAYIQHCQQLAAANGTPFDLQVLVCRSVSA